MKKERRKERERGTIDDHWLEVEGMIESERE